MRIKVWLKLFGSATIVVGIIAGIGTLDAGMGTEGRLMNLMIGLGVLTIMSR